MSIKRETISKKIRFEVFKRDNFQCQYCGQTAPSIVLNVDHIDPVAKGGTSELINLITSCFDCNQGKKATPLSDDTSVQKQRKQLEIIQEKREQLELMLEWKKSLSLFEDEKITMISNYWASLMKPFHLNEDGKKSLEQLLRRFSVEDVLEAIAISTDKYLKYDSANGTPTEESVVDSFNKLGGICAVKKMPEINQKLAYIKGICKNRFIGNWNAKIGSIILNSYVNALKNYGWTSEQILKDLEEEVIPMTREATDWVNWKSTLEKWTNDIKNWKKEEAQKEEVTSKSATTYEHSLDSLETHAYVIITESVMRLKALLFIGKVFPYFDKEILKEYFFSEIEFVLTSSNIEYDEITSIRENSKIHKLYEIPTKNFPGQEVAMVLEATAHDCINYIIESFNLNSGIYSDKDKLIIKNILLGNINDLRKSNSIKD